MRMSRIASSGLNVAARLSASLEIRSRSRDVAAPSTRSIARSMPGSSSTTRMRAGFMSPAARQLRTPAGS